MLGAILPRVFFLAPHFPFAQLLDGFDEADDKDAAERAVASSIDAAMAHFCPQAGGSGGGGSVDESPFESLSGGSASSSGGSSFGTKQRGPLTRTVSLPCQICSSRRGVIF